MDTNGFNEARTSISCENIPELFLDKLVAKSHFSQFGKIKRFILRPNRLSCTVEYERTEAAQLALEKGAQFKNVIFSIFWTDQKPQLLGDGGKAGGSFLDTELQMELETIDCRAQPAANALNIYNTGEQRPTSFSNFRSMPTKPPMTAITVRPEMDSKTQQTRIELETLARKPATSAEERYRVLEAKDRYIRLTTERTTDIRKAKNIVGTCPDMCPEKERYMREWKCMVPSYERQLGGSGSQIDHVKAIKQYSRSSADQELPLPHELRSPQALGRTMHFLLTNLADQCDNGESEVGANVSDWFHYIWDRTRGVRKDITQQDLCSPEVVVLMEQCTRFHIHCAARLVSEDPSVFDQKINTENMTKCLQTLKYMYTDLAQRGHRCPAEAEFRAYMVLLYLNDGNFLWELRQLPESIIHSSEIQFALSVYFALEENNYVRFFQLVRSTSYMNSCILLRYFTQVRQKAIDVIRKTYALRTTTSFSLEYLTRILGFENEPNAEAFFDHYGIVTDRGLVVFESKQFYQPEFPFVTGRALQLVESKRTTSVGEAICGRPLAQWGEQFSSCTQPNDSFDVRGCLKEQILEVILRGRKDMEEHLLTNQPSDIHELKDTSKEIMEEDKIDYTEVIAQVEPPTDDKLLFKIPSPTTTVPRLSPRARTPPLQATGGLFADKKSHLVTPIGDTGGATIRSLEAFPSNKHSMVTGGLLQAPTTGNGLFANVKPSDNHLSVSNSSTSGNNLFGSFVTPITSAPAKSENVFGSVGFGTIQPNNTERGDSVTMRYSSPPQNRSITPAGHKRTFFGATKAMTSPLKAVQNVPAAPTASATPVAPLVSAGSFFLPTPAAPPALTSDTSIFGSKFGGVRSSLKGPATVGSATTVGTSLLSGVHFPQPVMQRNENKETENITPPRMETIRPIAIDQDQKAREELQQEQLKREKKRKEEDLRRSIERASTIELEKLIDSVVNIAVLEIADAALERHKLIHRFPSDLFSQLVDELLADVLAKVAREEVVRIERLRTNRARQLCEKYFHRWHRNAQRATQWRGLLRTVPPSFISGRFLLDELPSSNQLQSFLNSRLTGMNRKADEVLQDRSVHKEVFLFDDFPERELIDPFTVLASAIAPLVSQSRQGSLNLSDPFHWKLAISVPVEGEEGSIGFPSFVHRWLERCAFRKDEEDGRNGKSYFYFATRTSSSIQQNKSSHVQGQGAICVRLVRGRDAKSENNTDNKQACQLMHGLLFFLNDQCIIDEARDRLQRILSKSDGPTPTVAIVLYHSNGKDSEKFCIGNDTLTRTLGLNKGIVKDWRVFSWSKATDNSTLRAALKYLADCYITRLRLDTPHHNQRLEMRSLGDFLERCVGSELWYRFDKSGRLVGQRANVIVQLYNAALEQVASMVTRDLKQFIRLPREFSSVRYDPNASKTCDFSPLSEAYFPPDWHSIERRKRLQWLLESLKLRPLPSKLLSLIERAGLAATQRGTAFDIMELNAELNKYLSGYPILVNNDRRELSTLIQKFVQGVVTQLAGYAYENETQPLEDDEQQGRLCYWVPLLALVSEAILRVLVTYARNNAQHMLPLEVCYLREEFVHHTETVWWKDQFALVQLKSTPRTELISANSCSHLDPSYVSIRLSTSVSDRKRSHPELTEKELVSFDGDKSNDKLNVDTSGADISTINVDSNDSGSTMNVSQHADSKRAKIGGGGLDFDDVIEKGMKALVRAEQLLSRKHTTTSELQDAFDPLEKKILQVENSCRSLNRLHGSGTIYK